MDNYLSQLNDQQRAAVEYCDGPQLVIAGAGSGKTRVLTYKIVHLLAAGHQPWRILALTFTNKAAREMRQRIELLTGEATASKLRMGTFHSVFARLLRAHAELIGFRSDFTIYDTADSKQLVKMIIKDMDLDEKVYKVSTVLNIISSAKNALVSPERYAADRETAEYDRRARRERMPQIYAAYMHRCRVASVMDFDDLLYYTNVLLRDRPEVLRHYQEYFSYVLVDEYQDTNFAQHMIITMLSQVHQHLCVVGDDAQSIYSFRGANIRNILNLRNAYPGLKTFKLERNYRSTQVIVDAAGSLIAKNVEQIPKNVRSQGEKGDLIEVVRAYSDYEEAALVANRITRLKRTSGDSYEDFAILYRTNAQSRVLEEALRSRSIPYRIYGGLSFYQRKEIKDAVAYFRLAVNPHDDEALKRIINFPPRGIGDTTVGKLSHAAITAGVSMWQVLCDPARYGLNVNKGTMAKLDLFGKLIGSFGEKHRAGDDADALARHILSQTGMITMYYSDTTPENISKRQNLEELLAGTREFVDDRLQSGDGDHIYMPDFLALASLATDQDEGGDEEQQRVTLMTIHAAKGLEFTNIFIVGAEEDLLPSAMSKDSASAVEEERRLLYVAMTRAKRFCMISYASQRYRNGQTVFSRPSRFLRDIDSSYLNIVAGGEDNYSSMRRAGESSFHSSQSWGGRGVSQRNGLGNLPGRGLSGTGATSQRSSAVSPPAINITPQSVPAASRTTTYRSGTLPTDKSLPDAAPHAASELAPQMRIEHSRFGKGTIEAVDTSQPDARIQVSFDNSGTKILLLKFAKFTIL